MNAKLPNRFEVSFQNFRKFSWKERLQIAFGYNAVINTTVRVDKRTGQTWQNSTLQTTKQVTPEDQIKADENV